MSGDEMIDGVLFPQGLRPAAHLNIKDKLRRPEPPRLHDRQRSRSGGTRQDFGRETVTVQDLLLAALAPGALSSVLNVAFWRKRDTNLRLAGESNRSRAVSVGWLREVSGLGRFVSSSRELIRRMQRKVRTSSASIGGERRCRGRTVKRSLGDGASTPTGMHLGCVHRRHFALVVTVRNRSRNPVTLCAQERISLGQKSASSRGWPCSSDLRRRVQLVICSLSDCAAGAGQHRRRRRSRPAEAPGCSRTS